MIGRLWMKDIMLNHIGGEQNRIGIDLDSLNQFVLLKTYFNVKYMFPNREIEIAYSPSGRGYHIRILFPKGVKNELNLKAREILGDDPCRIDISYRKWRLGERYIDVLFNWKNGKWEEYFDEKSLLALPFWRCRFVKKFRNNFKKAR